MLRKMMIAVVFDRYVGDSADNDDDDDITVV
jgi:hypothetical protein